MHGTPFEPAALARRTRARGAGGRRRPRTGQQRERGVLELHADTAEDLHGGLDVEQVQLDRLRGWVGVRAVEQQDAVGGGVSMAGGAFWLRRVSARTWSWPKTAPEARLASSEYAIWPAAPVTQTMMGAWRDGTRAVGQQWQRRRQHQQAGG